jgi:hypothetical protein
MKALTLPRDQLSKLWQCSTPHNNGDLFHSQCRGTPYQPILPKKSTNYICSDRASTSKRFRSLRSPPTEIPHCPILETPSIVQVANSVVTPLLPMQLTALESQRDLARVERDLSRRERDRLLNQQLAVIQEKDRAILERNQAIIERDLAISSCDELRECYEEKVQCCSAQLQKIADLEKLIDELQQQNNILLDKKAQHDELIRRYSENLSQLSQRVNTLEQHRYRINTVTVGSTGEPLRYIRNFTEKLFPDVDKKSRLNALFDLVYSRVKSFRRHVKGQLKMELLPLMRLDICREIKRYYSAWRFLEVMDSSSQSLNQVTLFNA